MLAKEIQEKITALVLSTGFDDHSGVNIKPDSSGECHGFSVTIYRYTQGNHGNLGRVLTDLFAALDRYLPEAQVWGLDAGMTGDVDLPETWLLQLDCGLVGGSTD